MIDWDAMIEALEEISAYFTECANNAKDGSRMHRRYTGYVRYASAAADILRDANKEEDDGK